MVLLAQFFAGASALGFPVLLEVVPALGWYWDTSPYQGVNGAD